MLDFRSFLLQNIQLNESIRQGLPHITSMDHHQFGNLMKGGKIHFTGMTEKTDGQTHKFGYDEHGFYTQSSGSGSEKMRSAKDFEDRVRKRSQETGKPVDLTASNAFGHVHSILQNNKALQNHLKKHYDESGHEVSVRGELFYRPWGQKGDRPDEVKFVGTSYSTSHMGKVGKYVIHTKLPENQKHDVEHFKKHLSDNNINFDDDTIKHKNTHIDVSDEANEYSKLNHELFSQRTSKSNKEAKEAEIAKLRDIQTRVSSKVDDHIKKMKLQPKWGSGSEGIVVHPSKENPEAPRFKVTSDAFRSYKASDASKTLKDRNPIKVEEYKQFLIRQFITLKEEQEKVHHATVIPLMGVSPVSHMGHKLDLGDTMKKLPGTKHLGMSSKETTFSSSERENVLKKQWNMPKLNVHHTSSGGEVIGNAYKSLPETGKKVLHILVGHDRKEFAHGLKQSLEKGSIKEMQGKKWDEIHVHHPEDTNRSHGFSGTSLRQSVANNDKEAFDRHIGPMFTDQEKTTMFSKIRSAITKGSLKIKRK